MPSRVQSFSVMKAAALRVTSGVNHGEAMGLAEDVLLEDVYELGGDAALQTLKVNNTHAVGQSTLSIHVMSKLGHAGSTLAIDSARSMIPKPLAETLMKRHITDGPATDLSFEIAEGMLTGNAVELLRHASGG